MVYILLYYRNLKSLNHVIIIKPKVLIPQALVTLVDLNYSVYAVRCSSSQRLLNYLALNLLSMFLFISISCNVKPTNIFQSYLTKRH